METNWENVTSSGKAPHDDVIRGSFHLYFYPKECDLAWKIIRRMTRHDKLGHMSSLSPDVMDGGKFKGAFTISVHTILDKKPKVGTILKAANLGANIFKFNLTKRFRRHSEDDGEWYFKSKNDEMSTEDEISEDDASDNEDDGEDSDNEDDDEASENDNEDDDEASDSDDEVHLDKGIKRKLDDYHHDMVFDSDYESDE